PLHLAHWGPALVIEDLEHPELGGAEVEAGDTRPGVALDGVEGPGQHHPQPQGRVTRNRCGSHHRGNLPAGQDVPNVLRSQVSRIQDNRRIRWREIWDCWRSGWCSGWCSW